MKKITVSAGRSYDVLIGANILSCLGRYTSDLTRGRRAVIISDENVWPLYGDAVMSSLQASAFTVGSHVIKAGEEYKSLQTYAQLLNYFTEFGLTRSDVVIALGGGVVGDLSGFAAATYLRGISYIQIPTTLLSMVDSSIGGKSAINLASGKNLAGAFCQPALVICDIMTLNSLPADILREGCSEILKYGILFDATLFAHMSERSIAFDREYVIARCIELKSAVVARDELEHGERILLNLGHTVAHAVEKLSKYEISHGNAVAMGIGTVSRAAAKYSYCTADTAKLIVDSLQSLGLPTSPSFSSADLFTSACADKKRRDDRILLIVPEMIGKCRVVSFGLSDLKAFLEAGL